MNYGKPEDDKLPIHEQVRQSRAALCGMAVMTLADAALMTDGMTPLITDESTARCVEYPHWTDAATSNEDKKAELHHRSARVAAMEALARERDDLARRCADLENTISRMQAEYESRGVGVRLPAAGVPQSDYDRLLASYHASTRLARELQAALGKARDEIESLKAQGPHSSVAPALSPHDMPAALGDCLGDEGPRDALLSPTHESSCHGLAANISGVVTAGETAQSSQLPEPAALGDCDRGELIWSSDLPEPARLNESIPGSAVPQVLAVTAKPAPVPMPARALRYSR